MTKLLAALVAALVLSPLGAAAQTILYSPNSLPLSGDCGTVIVSTPCLNLSQTWNAGGVTFTGLKFNATDTASASGSLLLDLQVGGSSKASWKKDGTYTFTGGILASTDNTYDIGASGANRPRNVYVAGTGTFGGALSISSGGIINAQGAVQTGTVYGLANGTNSINVGGPGGMVIGSPSLQFNGTTSSFPAIKRSSATLAFRLADDSADAAITTAGITASGDYKSTGTIPTVSGTGSPTIASGSTDTAGEVTGGTSATSIVITFAAAKTNAPFCTVTSQTALTTFAYTISTTAITITLGATTGEKVDYHCVQH